jgi:uncharacterized protein (DUF885 family)
MVRAVRLLAVALFGLALTPSAHAATPNEATALARLCDEYWQTYLQFNPTTATSIGDRRFDAFLENNSPAALAKEQRFLEDVLARARAMDEATLGADDRLNRAALIEEVSGQLGVLGCHFEKWEVDPRNGPQTEFMNLPDYTTIDDPADADRFVSRVQQIGKYVDQHVLNLRTGLREGLVANREAIEVSIRQLDELLAQPIEAWGLLNPLEDPHPKWSARERETFRANLTAAARTSVAPAFRRYRTFLRTRLLPVGRPQDKAGLVALPGGVECYRRMIRMHTSLDRTPEALHQLGLDEVARIRAALSELGGTVLGTTDLAEIQRRLRNDPDMHFRTAADVEAKARKTLARAKAAIPNWFGILPKADCQVKVMGMHEAPYSTIAYYRNPAMDGSRPGYYFINTYKPETRPTYEAEALAFHESIPGHHLQIAIAMELQGLPEFRKNQGVTAFVEGWGLYSERLAADMNLYSGDLDRIGMLSFDAWRACRLVVDTGIHAMGWSRQQAIDYMVANTVLAENNIANEVDRYITSPGQALAYKVGQLEFLALREEGRQRFGARFDIKAFHDVVLRNGAVALPVLRQQVEAYYAQVEGAK